MYLSSDVTREHFALHFQFDSVSPRNEIHA